LITTKLMNQRAGRSAVLEGRDDVGIGHTRELVIFLSEMPDIIPEGLAVLLLVALLVPRVTRAHVGALEPVETSRGSSQQLMAFLGRWSSQALADSAK
jgi:hypothetical protein